jgi:hypothetical protein
MPTIRDVLTMAVDGPMPPTRIDPRLAIETVRHQRRRRIGASLGAGALAITAALVGVQYAGQVDHQLPPQSPTSNSAPRFGGPITHDVDPLDKYRPPRGTPTISWERAAQLACRDTCGPGTVVYLADYSPFPYTHHRLVYVVHQPSSPGCFISGPARRAPDPPGWSCASLQETQIDAMSGKVQGATMYALTRLARDLGRAQGDTHVGSLDYGPPSGSDPALGVPAALTAACGPNKGAGSNPPLPYCAASLGVDVVLADVTSPNGGTRLSYVVTVHGTGCLATRPSTQARSETPTDAKGLCDITVAVDATSGEILNTASVPLR